MTENQSNKAAPAAAAQPAIPTNAVLNAMDDKELIQLAVAQGLPEPANRADAIKALKQRRQGGAFSGGTAQAQPETQPASPPPIQDDADLEAMDADQLADLLKAHGLPGLASKAEDVAQLKAKRDSILPAGALDHADEDPADQEDAAEGAAIKEEAKFKFELGAKVFLYERNHDPESSEPLDGYQPPKPGTIVKITEDTDTIDVRTGGETEAAITSHDIIHVSASDNGENYWSESADD